MQTLLDQVVPVHYHLFYIRSGDDWGEDLGKGGQANGLCGAAYPGSLTYAAHVTGTLTGDRLHVTVTVPSLTTVIGPFDLTRGASHNWTSCLYP